MPKKRNAGQAGVDSQDCAELTKRLASAADSDKQQSQNRDSKDGDKQRDSENSNDASQCDSKNSDDASQCDSKYSDDASQCDSKNSNDASQRDSDDSDDSDDQHNNHTIQMVHICYQHDYYNVHCCDHKTGQLGLHDIVLDDQVDIVWFRCCECKLWLQHDVCSDNFFMYDYRDTCQVVHCCQCGVFLTDILLTKNEETIMRFDDIKKYAYSDAKLEAKFRKKLSLPDDVPIDLFNIPLVQVDAYCNVNSPSKICNENTVICPASYNAHSMAGLDFNVSYVRRQHDKKFVYLASD